MAIGFTLLDDTIAVPDKHSPFTYTPRVNKIQFGNGFEQRDADGINTNEISVQVSFNKRPKAEIDEIKLFLKDRANFSVAFSYTYNDNITGGTPVETTIEVTCNEWKEIHTVDNYWSLNATFVKIFKEITITEPLIVASNALVHLKSDGIEGAHPVTAWINSGTGGSAFDYNTVIGTGANLTEKLVNGKATVHSTGSVGLETAADAFFSANSYTEIIVFKSDSAAQTDAYICDDRRFAGGTSGVSTDGSGYISFHGHSGNQQSSSKIIDTQVNAVIFNRLGAADSTGHLTGHSLGSETWTGDAPILSTTAAGSLFQEYNNGSRFIGNICEYIVFDHVVSPENMVLLYNWINSKWASNNNPVKDIFDTALVWYKETGIVGDPVTQWTNEGFAGSDFDLDVVGGTSADLVKTTVNSLEAVQNLSDAYIESTTPSLGLGYSHAITLFVVLSQAPIPLSTDSRVFGNRQSSGNNLSLRITSLGIAEFYNGTAWIPDTSGDIESDLHLIVVQYREDSSASIQVDDSPPATGDAGSDSAGAFGVLFNNYQHILYPFNGIICEFMIFNGEMNSITEQLVRDYLMDKWGV